MLMLVGLASILINHFLVDWRSATDGKIRSYFDRLVEDQKADLLTWSQGTLEGNTFQRRTYCNGKLERWSDDRPWIDELIQSELSVVEDGKGIFLAQRIDMEGGCFVISIYPLAKEYSISNKYLKSRLAVSLPKDLSTISLEDGSFKYRDLFYYEITESSSRSIDAIAFILIVVSSLIFLWLSLSKYFFASIGAMIAVRALTLWFSLFETLIRYPIFDSLYYTSSRWNPTLGDLFLNCLLIFIVTLKWSRRFRYRTEPSSSLGYIYIFLSIAVSTSVFTTAWSILDNSQLSLDVGKSIEFGFLRVVAYLTVLLMVCSHFLITFRLSGFLISSTKRKVFYLLLIVMPFGLWPFSLPAFFVGLLNSVIIILASRLNWGERLRDFKYANLQFALVVSLAVAAVLAATAYKYYEKSELDAKKKFANHLLIKRDVLGEYYLNQVLQRFEDEMLEESRKEVLKETIRDQLLNTYFDKYEIKVISEDSDSLMYVESVSQLTQDKLSDYDNIYFLDDDSGFKYVCKIGSVLAVLKLRKRVPTSVFPALLTDSKYFTPSEDFDYAVFRNGEILFQRSKFGQGEWPEARDFEDWHLFSDGIEKNDRHYYGVKTVDNRVILIISKKYGRQLQLTNFSFFFLLSLFCLGSIVLLSSVKFSEAKLNFTGKIQLYLGLAFIVPLFSAGFALLNSLNTSYREEINRSYLKRSLYISELLSNDAQGSAEQISSEKLAEIRDIIQADITLYDKTGKLVSTSQREIFELELLSNLVNPTVFEELLAKENQSMIADESIGGLEYKVSYATLNNGADQVIGFIAMPFFDSKNHLRRQQLEVFGSLVSIFGLIFIIAILFGNLVLDNLLLPLRIVADKIRQITLQEENKPILYESSDEIGSLVKDYNHMLVKLEESKAALARSQKETAWKEIARQVAHEIKNPLTPMQLKIQQLLRKSESGSKDHETLTALLVQVDTLSQIAGSFSAFAEMPAPNNSVFDLSKVLRQVINLYNSSDVIVESSIEDEAMVEADKDIFQRILNNIVLNAIQSVEDSPVRLKIDLVKKSEKCELSVSDNGRGIPEEVRDKIFLNYFSTKSTGSGIGLALAKKGIENAGGNIWFESKEKGTTFFISMPLVAS